MNFASILEYDELANFSLSSLSHKVQNLQALTIHDYGRYFLFEPNFRITKISTRLWLDKTTGQIIEKDFNEKEFLLTKNFKSKRNYSAFLGFLNLMNQHFLVLVEQTMLNCQIEGHDIYSVCSLDFLPFEDMEIIKKSSDWKVINHDMEIIKNLLSFGFYYSYTYDLTLSTDKISKGQNDRDPKFWWNGFMLKDLRAQNIRFHEKFRSLFNGEKVRVLPDFPEILQEGRYTIQRERYFLRLANHLTHSKPGVDDDGFVANHVETEQIIYYSFYKCSFCQVRGSVPLFWDQKGITAYVRLNRSLETTKSAFKKHFDDLKRDYHRVICVNLMSAKKKSEQSLTEQFEQLIQESQINGVKYEFFDFHYACKAQKYENVDSLIEKLASVVENSRFFAAKVKQDPHLIFVQQGVLRVNCLDCLDRTNLVQTKFAALMLQNIMTHMNTDLNLALGEDFIKLLDIPISQSKKFHPFIYYFKNAWADNGDFLSVHYAGTGSTTSTITRTSKVGFLNMLDHGMKSIERFYINNFEDHVKQAAIDIVLGQQTGDLMSKYEETLASQLLEKRHEYIAFDNLKVGVVTWNVNSYHPNNDKLDLSELFSSFKDSNYTETPDIIAIGLQEVDNSAFNNLLNSEDGEKNEILWQNILKSNVNKMDTYYEISHLSYYGCFLIVFAKISLKERVKKIQFDEVNFSALANFSKKGALLIKFNVNDSSLCFINCHLESGNNSFKERLQNLETIHNSGFNGELESFEYKFLFGDMNFRLQKLNDLQIRRQLEKYHKMLEIKENLEATKVLKDLFESDDIWELRKSSKTMENYQELEITFPPTYKYELGQEKYESKKTPAWCDRIMVWIDEDSNLGWNIYTRKEIKYSQHRPVCGLFEIEAKIIDQNKKGKIIQDYIVNSEKSKAKFEETG